MQAFIDEFLYSAKRASLVQSRIKVKFLLTNVGGKAELGRLLAIMGLSGSGKTSLLNVLVGQLAASPRLHLSGHLDVNGLHSSSRQFKIAYVRQEDMFFSQLIVCETLSLATEFQVTDVTSLEERDEYVKKLLFKFGLVNCANSIVGNAKVHGINGGEKKTLSLECKLIASPSVIFADEPITVLDAILDEGEVVMFEEEEVVAQAFHPPLIDHGLIQVIVEPLIGVLPNSRVHVVVVGSKSSTLKGEVNEELLDLGHPSGVCRNFLKELCLPFFVSPLPQLKPK